MPLKDVGIVSFTSLQHPAEYVIQEEILMARSAFGTRFEWNGEAVAELTNIGGVEVSVDMIDATSHQSTDGFKEVIAGLADAGEVTIEGNFDYTDTDGQLAMVADCASKTSRSAVITFPGNIATWTFTAFVSKLKVGDNSIDGKIPFSASLKITGKPVLSTSVSNDLTNLQLTTATLYPVFAPSTYNYVATSTGDSLTVTATFSAGTCTLTANGVEQQLTSTQPSSTISLGSDGDMTEIVIKVQETGKSAKTYTIRVANESAG